MPSRIKVGPDGFVELIDHMGSDEDVVKAARISYGKGTKKTSGTRNLLRYLMRHRHTSPFEMCELKFHVRVPMDTWRQWIRHRTASVNEYSTRYSEAINSMATTRSTEWRKQSTNNKQGSGEFLNKEDGEDLTYGEISLHEHARNVYKSRLEDGVAREQARKDLPLSTYTEAIWKIDLHNLLHFLKLRLDKHAQLEIRSYALAIAHIVKECYPMTWEAFEDYTLHAVTFSRIELSVLKQSLYFGWEDYTDPAEWEGKTECRERDDFEAKIRSILNESN